MKTRLIVLNGIVLALIAGALMAQPRRTVAPKKHPNLATAQRHIDQAWESVNRAQAANEWDLAGHAKRAKELLEQANREIKQAAETANRN